MNVSQIILTLSVFLASCVQLAAQQPVAQYPNGVAPVVVGGPQYLQSAPVITQPTAPSGVPIYPPGSTVVPLPSQTPGSIFGPQMAPPGAVMPGQPGVVGTEQLPSPPGTFQPGTAPQGVVPGGPVEVVVQGPPNPIAIPVVDDELAWDQIADVVSDYFTITREQRARRAGEVWTEGRIETAPLDGATWLEPHRHDSVGSFNRWESTFQSIRRRATVRVTPDANGYLVEVIVEKELEDLPKPEKSTAGAAAFQPGITLPSNRLEQVSRTRSSTRWLSLGRDPALEQRMLAEIHARANGVSTSHFSIFGFGQ